MRGGRRQRLLWYTSLHGRNCWHSTTQSSMSKPDIDRESRFLLTPPTFDAVRRGEFHRHIAITFGMEKLEWCGYQTVTNFEDRLTPFDRIQERDGRTDRQTDTSRRHRPRLCIASRRKTSSGAKRSIDGSVLTAWGLSPANASSRWTWIRTFKPSDISHSLFSSRKLAVYTNQPR